ncbi:MULTISPECIES: excalibur calcium-binding domain-containing protein [Bacillus]|nr:MULTISPECIES: excalibur calcium-binding domain-containing protein [Bacillus cereus group]MDA1991986.1 excalibur calcium-binding domain-containing protein [Bacillus cereus]MDA1997830.1 excalibur calcium-binding domain-containing protein [Bacillus cereus]MDA2515575.1 excalibur calcium-binding domain-containing protein [Bacillus cereus]MDA3651159.1 excalibur calcium-binding domain-containing protein [Bacillus cereus]WPQ39567.1 excalibur calcium-binding domain-containing protein [Bacillus cereu
MKEKEFKDFIKVLKLLLIVGCVYAFILILECIVSSIWNLLLFLAIILVILWCYYRKKKEKRYTKGILILIILILLAIWSIGPCVYQRHIAQMEKTELEEKQREIEGNQYIKKMEEDAKKAQDEAKEESAKRKAEEDKSKNSKKEKHSSTPNYNFKEDRDCPDFRNASEATEFMKKSKAAGFGDHRLDRNGDGIACN